jgi:amino acid transporter
MTSSADGEVPGIAGEADGAALVATGRTVGMVGAVGVGVGAIVGGGILALAGAAFAVTGPPAIIAFALNGAIAVLTALSFAEMSTAFPQSGGAYLFAKKVLNVQAAFGVGWVLWFAYIVAAVLYALGFAEYGAAMLYELWAVLDPNPPAWLH